MGSIREKLEAVLEAWYHTYLSAFDFNNSDAHKSYTLFVLIGMVNWLRLIEFIICSSTAEDKCVFLRYVAYPLWKTAFMRGLGPVSLLYWKTQENELIHLYLVTFFC
jgi:hypothetical protein